MKKWAFFLLAGIVVSSAKAEELHTLTLLSLVYRSPVIFSAKPLQALGIQQKNNGSDRRIRLFLVLDILRHDSGLLPDTVAVSFDDYEFSRQERGAEIVFDTVVFYGDFYQNEGNELTEPLFYPTSSGIRLFHQDSMFTPIQISNPGSYYFIGGQGISASDWILKTQQTIVRLDKVLALRHIQPLSVQNKMIFEWIAEHRTALKNSNPFYSLDEDNNWGELRWDIFKWINGNGIWEDAWSGILLSYEIDSLWPILSRPEGAENAFNNEEARAFLMVQITSENGRKFPALFLLGESLWKPNSLTESVSATAQIAIMKLALPLLQDPQLRTSALQLLENAAFPPEYSWQYRTNLSLLPDLKRQLEQLEQPVEEYFRDNLVRLITKMEKAQRG